MKSNHVTQKCNTVQKRMTTEEFRKIGRRVNHQGYDFCFKDFQISKGTFRQKIHRLKDEIILTNGGRPCFYRFKDIYTGPEKGNVTLEGMGVGKEFEELLHDTNIQHPQIHDIKLKFHSTQAHHFLKTCGWKFNTSNKCLSIKRMPLAKWTWVTISVYPETVVIDLGCTSQPVVYDSRGALELVMYLDRVRQFMIKDSLELIEDIPDPTEWIVTQYHLNKDGFREYSGEKFHITIEEMTGGIIRFYSKTFPDQRTRTRLEQIEIPKSPVKKIVSKMINSDTNGSLPSIKMAK